MDEILNYINEWVLFLRENEISITGVIGIIVSAVAIIVSILLLLFELRKTVKDKKLECQVKKVALDENLEGIKLLEFEFEIHNTGTAAVSKNDFELDEKGIVFKFSKPRKVFTIEQGNKSKNKIPLTIFQESNSSIYLSPFLLNPNEFIDLKITTEFQDIAITMLHRINGIGKIPCESKQYGDSKNLIMPFLIWIAFGYIADYSKGGIVWGIIYLISVLISFMGFVTLWMVFEAKHFGLNKDFKYGKIEDVLIDKLSQSWKLKLSKKEVKKSFIHKKSGWLQRNLSPYRTMGYLFLKIIIILAMCFTIIDTISKIWQIIDK